MGKLSVWANWAHQEGRTHRYLKAGMIPQVLKGKSKQDAKPEFNQWGSMWSRSHPQSQRVNWQGFRENKKLESNQNQTAPVI